MTRRSFRGDVSVMPDSKQISLGPLRLDLVNECLWRGSDSIALRPKAYAVLKHLIDRRGQLVTKQQLLEAVWPGTYVGDAVLKTTIRQLREALGDDAESPRYIQTAHRRGYRFVADVGDQGFTAAQALAPSGDEAAERASSSGASPRSAPHEILGRDSELSKLRALLHRALDGERQVVFVTGEAGIGKTTLVSALLDHATTIDRTRTARGQCLEQYGAGEAYLPVLEALSRLGRGPDGERVVACLRRFAPTWLRELPSLIGRAGFARSALATMPAA